MNTRIGIRISPDERAKIENAIRNGSAQNLVAAKRKQKELAEKTLFKLGDSNEILEDKIEDLLSGLAKVKPKDTERHEKFLVGLLAVQNLELELLNRKMEQLNGWFTKYLGLSP